ncbi:MAG TPA: outer membrane beta-barrel protein [Bacteroidia bacterium]|nr:outer membrane beta-barrel protein [Bacteroidia bacterium]
MKALLFCIASAFSSIVLSQNAVGKITGNTCNKDKKPTGFLNVVLYRSNDSSLVKVVLSDDNGFFEFEPVAPDTYFIKISGIGIEPYASDLFSISAEKYLVDFTDIILMPGSKGLDEVIISADKQFIERKLDRLVVNVENSIVSAGNNVLEVLQRAPGVVVNEESGINMKGKSGVLVMIDGKPNPLSGPELMSYLKSIPASNVQSIELISNPSAKYDAAGNAGIINIKFKKDKRQGFNGSATASYGQGIYPKPACSASFNLREKAWNFFGSYSYSQPVNFTYFYINRKFFDQNHYLASTFEQTSYTRQPFSAHNTRLGVDFFAGKKTVIGIMVNGNWNEGKRDGTTNANVRNNLGSLNYTTRTGILLNEKRFIGFGNVNLKHTFDSTGRELTADIDLGSFAAKTFQDVRNTNFSPDGTTLTDARLATNQKGDILVRSFKADYVHPITGKDKLEFGIKSGFVTSNNEVKFFNVINEKNILDTSRSNHFIYDENINAAYFSYAKELTKWDLQCGLRMEHTNTKGEQLRSGETFSRNYISLFPNVVVNRKFTDESALSLSYARRIDRPSYRQLNPFKVFVDSYTYVVGDPALKPVMTNICEVNYTFKGKYITTVSYTNSKQSITDIFVQDDISKISYQTPANIRDFEQYNIGLYIPFKIKKLMKSTISGSVYRNIYASPLQGGNLQQSFNSWDLNINNVFTLGNKGWSAELNGFYQSKMVWGLFYIKSLAQVTAGVQKTSKNKNSVFKFSISDIFLTNHIAVIVQYQNQDFVTERNWDSRVATLSYTYRFGKSTVTKSRQHTSGVEDEKRRAG